MSIIRDVRCTYPLFFLILEDIETFSANKKDGHITQANPCSNVQIILQQISELLAPSEKIEGNTKYLVSVVHNCSDIKTTNIYKNNISITQNSRYAIFNL